MIKNFTYHNPTKVYFGNGELAHLHEELPHYGQRVLFVCGGRSIKESGLYDKISQEITKAGMTGYSFAGVKPNPEVEDIRTGIRLCRQQHLDLIIAAGGGSVIDAAKAIAGAVPYADDPWDLIKTRAQIPEALPIIAIPTMASTGSEMNACCVITNPDTEEKYGWTTEALRPKVTFLCPEHTYTVPAFQTAAGSADILSHLMEVYFNLDQGFSATDGFIEAMMRSVIHYAPIAMAEGNNEEARANLLWTASWAINNYIDRGHHTAWICHGIEHELSAIYHITHGLGLAILTPAFLTYVLNENTAPKIAQFAVNVMGVKRKGKSDMAVAKKGIKKLAKFFTKDLQLAGKLSEIGIDDTRFAEMAAKTIAWKGNQGIIHGFQDLTAKDLEEIYRLAL